MRSQRVDEDFENFRPTHSLGLGVFSTLDVVASPPETCEIFHNFHSVCQPHTKKFKHPGSPNQKNGTVSTPLGLAAPLLATNRAPLWTYQREQSVRFRSRFVSRCVVFIVSSRRSGSYTKRKSSITFRCLDFVDFRSKRQQWVWKMEATRCSPIP